MYGTQANYQSVKTLLETTFLWKYIKYLSIYKLGFQKLENVIFEIYELYQVWLQIYNK